MDGSPQVVGRGFHQVQRLAPALHDRDDKGLDIVPEIDASGRRPANGHPWRAFGDGHLPEPQSADTRQMVTAAGFEGKPVLRSRPCPERGHEEPEAPKLTGAKGRADLEWRWGTTRPSGVCRSRQGREEADHEGAHGEGEDGCLPGDWPARHQDRRHTSSTPGVRGPLGRGRHPSPGARGWEVGLLASTRRGCCRGCG